MNNPIVDQMRTLILEIEKHRRKYYLEENPEISDAEYDSLERKLRKLEKTYPKLIQSDSPSFRVGGAIADLHPPKSHSTPMLSLDNAYDEEEIEEFLRKAQESVQESVQEPVNTPMLYTAELKIDGLSLGITYRYGSLAHAITRGDGVTGEEVTANAKTIRNLPFFIPSWKDVEEVEVRGEVYLSKSRFIRLNELRLDNNQEPFANPRNAASGSLRLLDSSESAARGLNIFIYQALGPWADEIGSHKTILETLKKLCFPVNPHTFSFKHLEEIVKHLSNWQERRKTLDYETDGMVIKVDNCSLHPIIGATSKFPKWAIAYKFQAEQATTRVNSISIQVGRTGTLTPVAELEPVSLAGTTVSRATLHNFEEIVRKDIRAGDRVFIEKGGDIIPKVIKVILSQRASDSKAYVPPTSCPCCGQPVEKEHDQVAIRCVNLSCPEQIERRIRHFAARKAMDIRGLGKEWVQQLVAKGLLTDLPSIYHLKKEQLLPLERTGEKWIENLLREIEQSKTRPFEKVLFGVGIPMVGEKAAELLVNHFLSFEAMFAASEEEIASIHGIGDQMADSITHHLRLESYMSTFNAFKGLGLQLKSEKNMTDAPMPLLGKTIVITGTLANWSRVEAGAFLKSLGANVTSSISKKTNFLLAGEKAGSKLAKAMKLEVKIVDEEWLESWQKE